MLSWRGYGYLGFMIPFCLAAGVQIFLGSGHVGTIRFSFFVSAMLVWTIGTRLNGEETHPDGKAIHLTNGFPLKWGGLGFSVLGLALTFA